MADDGILSSQESFFSLRLSQACAVAVFWFLIIDNVLENESAHVFRGNVEILFTISTCSAGSFF